MTDLEAIADPVRLHVIRHLQEHPEATLRQLAAAAGVHPNTARPHLAALLGAGVLATSAAPATGAAPGRPPVRYRLDGAPTTGVLVSALASIGFEARLDGDTLQLESCPCPRLRPDRPDLICDLAMSLTEGVLAGCGSPARVTARSHDPVARRCSARIRTRRTPR